MHTERTQAIAHEGIRCLGAAGLKKHLPAVTTARSRARETRSVAAAARQLFFSFFLRTKKKFHCAHRAQQPQQLNPIFLELTQHEMDIITAMRHGQPPTPARPKSFVSTVDSSKP